MDAAKLHEAHFTSRAWDPENFREYDDFIQCDGCDKWYHFICAMYPAPDQLPRAWRLEKESFMCHHCRPAPALDRTDSTCSDSAASASRAMAGAVVRATSSR